MWLCDFIKNNNDMFNLLIGVLGLVVSFLGVYYGKKAYIAANKIFQKGIQIGRKEILEQISLEFTTEFFIPFSLFKGGTKNLWIGRSMDQMRVRDIRNAIKKYKFHIRFSYYDSHKGDLWNALNQDESVKQGDAYRKISEFTEKARGFERMINDLQEMLEDYLECKNYKGPKKKIYQEQKIRYESKMTDFLSGCDDKTKRRVENREKLLEELNFYENQLSRFLSISDIKKKLHKKRREESIICELYTKNLHLDSVNLLAWGTSVLVYLGKNKKGSFILKELFPEGLYEQGVIDRNEFGVVYREKRRGKNRAAWKRARIRFILSVFKNRHIRKKKESLERFLPRDLGMFSANGTLYALYPDAEGSPWSDFHNEMLKKSILRCSRIAAGVAELHQAGWLAVDIKSTNFLIYGTEGYEKLQLIDFDSMVHKRWAKLKKRFYCSSETAPWELLDGKGRYAGEHSDVYSLAAMLFNKITGFCYNSCKTLEPLHSHIQELPPEKQEKMLRLMESALREDIKKRCQSAMEFSVGLQEILE